MILLLGGTSETREIATALAENGHQVLVSTATDLSLDVGHLPKIRRRCGRLHKDEMAELIATEEVDSIVIATHPYAAQVRAMASELAVELSLPCYSYVRPSAGEFDGCTFAKDHDEAAGLASKLKRNVLLTTGSNNLSAYAREAERTGLTFYIRILPADASVRACHEAGFKEMSIIAERGPFSIEQNRECIRKHNIGVLVTKDSGIAGGVPEKLKAANLEGCQVIVVRRPTSKNICDYQSISSLVEAIK